MNIVLNHSTTVIVPNDAPASVQYAVEDIQRDLANVFGSCDCDNAANSTAGAIIHLKHEELPAERYRVHVVGDALVVEAGDDLGWIYGLYAISRELLGVKDLWFWNDQHIEPVDSIEVPDSTVLAPKAGGDAVRYKGFFVNDEVLLEDWSVSNDPDLPWRRVFETILRLGGNTVIPGSGQRGEPHLAMARAMGLYINQHHATPLGAKLFSEAYPGVRARWPEEQERFEALWREAIKAGRGGRTIWTLGFRGQGDSPFWAADPRYDTDESRGRVMSEVIRRQYELVREADPEAPCSVYLYGEAMDLYRKGLLQFPDDVIKIWSDNGFGRMVSRRQGNWNPRIDAMPSAADSGRNGIYYHASFYDLQAANHITPLCVDPRHIVDELRSVLHNGGNDLWIINSSNVKPHTFMLDLIARMWRDGQVDVDAFEREYAAAYYGDAAVDAFVAGVEGYWQAAISYGPAWDDRAGEQFLNHVPRMLAVQFMRDRSTADPELRWMCEAGNVDATNLADQVRYYASLVEPAAERYRRLSCQLEASTAALEADHQRAARLLRDSILLHIAVYRHCSAGAASLCRALLAGVEGDWQHAFYYAGLARESFLAANEAMRSREHGKWRNYWRNDCLTDVKQTAMVCEALMGQLRAIGDGPHYYQWKRDFLYPAWEKDVMVIMNMENHESDQEIFAAMKAAWQE